MIAWLHRGMHQRAYRIRQHKGTPNTIGPSLSTLCLHSIQSFLFYTFSSVIHTCHKPRFQVETLSDLEKRWVWSPELLISSCLVSCFKWHAWNVLETSGASINLTIGSSSWLWTAHSDFQGLPQVRIADEIYGANIDFTPAKPLLGSKDAQAFDAILM